jgi:NAD(P)-dependent dehydrogenase (short-subunit alcohol dehydrogenase family)
MATYSVSKAALAHLTRVLDVELRLSGIRVNAVPP